MCKPNHFPASLLETTAHFTKPINQLTSFLVKTVKSKEYMDQMEIISKRLQISQRILLKFLMNHKHGENLSVYQMIKRLKTKTLTLRLLLRMLGVS